MALAGQAARGEVVVDAISKAYGTGPQREQVLERCTLQLAPGRLTVLIGPSGCGKSTLINMLAGYERPDEGAITIDGQPVAGPASDRLVVFQETALFPWMTTYQNVVYGPRVQRQRRRKDIDAEAMRLLDRVGLSDFRDKYPLQLSGGMQRRAELARAMINEPRLMLLDEPFRGLDAMTRELMQEYFLRLYEDKRQTVLFVTSEIEEAIFLADTLLLMSNKPGRIITSIEVALPRPRDPHALTSPEYLRYKEAALDTLHEEALKAFAGGSQAAADFVEAYEQRDGGR
ncbi:MAG: ABC transporter ATP-binding protein [Proteobacteria bacterium]|nr:MAG: ABC transporter ATP-binding protein [Pseudomonadota bacterium]